MNTQFAFTSAVVMLCWPAAALAGPALYASRTNVDWGYSQPGFPNDIQPVFITNTGDAPLTLTAMSLGGAHPEDFRFSGSCQVGAPIAPNDRCRVDLELSIVARLGPGESHSARLTIESEGNPSGTVIRLATNEHTPMFLIRQPNFTPDWLDFPAQPVGTPAASKTFVIRNERDFPMVVHAMRLAGGDASDFTLTNDCAARTLALGETCTATIGFVPGATGPRSTEVLMDYYTVSFTYRSVTGIGVASGSPAAVDVVEYYNASLDHYFITWIAAEQANLDAGNTPTRWTRTGSAFKAYTAAQTGSTPVCRYYIPPGQGDSHFFGRGTVECDATGAANPTFILEATQFMHLFLPVAGVCPAGTTPIYRVFSNRPDVNHRYMTDSAIRDVMVGRGWLAEGDGPDRVVMCSPS